MPKGNSKNSFEMGSASPDKSLRNSREKIKSEAGKELNLLKARFENLIEAVEKTSLSEGVFDNESIDAKIEREIDKEIELILDQRGEDAARAAYQIYELLKQNRKLRIDGITGLKRRGSFFESAEESLKSRELSNKIEFFRYGGDEFTALLTTKSGQVVTVFIDLAYLNRFNEAGGHEGGDMALRQTGNVLKNIAKRFVSEGYFEKKLPDLKLAEGIVQLLKEESEKVELPEEYQKKGLKIELDMGAASLTEAEEVFNLALRNEAETMTEGRKFNRKVEIMTRIADRRSEEVKARDRVFELTEYAEAALVAKSAPEKAEAEKILEGILEFSLKGMAGVKLEQLNDLAKIKDEDVRFSEIETLVTAGMRKKDDEATRRITREQIEITRVAKQVISPFLRNRPKSAA